MQASDITEKNLGNYVQLGGFGILDGLKFDPTKTNTMKILGVDPEGVLLKAYRAKYPGRLPAHKLSQPIRLYTYKEWKNFPVY